MSSRDLIAYVLLDLGLILLAARLTGWAFVKFAQPRVVGEIVAGVLLGPTILGTTSAELFPTAAQEVINGVGQVGLLFFALLIGLNLDLPGLNERLKPVLIIGLSVVAVPVAAGFAIGPVLATDTFKSPNASTLGFLLFVGAMLSVTALPVMVRILQEKELTTTPLANVGIAAAAVCTVAMFLITSVASSVSSSLSATRLLTDFGLSVIYIAGMPVVIGRLLKRLLAPSDDHQSARASFSLVLLFGLASGLVAHLLGLTVIIGGFMAGLVLPYRSRLSIEMDKHLGVLTTVFLLPVFLAYSGLQTDFTEITRPAVGGLVLLVLVAVTSKWASGAIGARLGGLTWSEGNALGVLMNCRGLLVLVVALVGLDAGVITPAMHIGAVAMALITTAMTGPLFNRFGPGSPTSVVGRVTS